MLGMMTDDAWCRCGSHRSTILRFVRRLPLQRHDALLKQLTHGADRGRKRDVGKKYVGYS